MQNRCNFSSKRIDHQVWNFKGVLANIYENSWTIWILLYSIYKHSIIKVSVSDRIKDGWRGFKGFVILLEFLNSVGALKAVWTFARIARSPLTGGLINHIRTDLCGQRIC